jgi:hypothetical protein
MPSSARSLAPSRVGERLRFGDRDKDHCLGRKLRWLFIGQSSLCGPVSRSVRSSGISAV